MPKRIKKPATKKPSSDPVVRSSQLMQEHQVKADAGASHSALRMTPAMAAGITNRLFDVSDLVALLVESEKTAA